MISITRHFNLSKFVDEKETKSLAGALNTEAEAALVRHATYTEVGDATGGTTTTYTASIGDTFEGQISSGGDQDWVAVNLVSGKSYVFWVRGTDGSLLGLSDTTLSVHNSAGVELASNDDASNSIYFSAIQLTATTTGTYYINVGSYGTETGNYALELSNDTFTIDEISTYLTEFDWGARSPLAFSVSTGGTITFNIDALTGAGQQLAEWALGASSMALGITFQRTSAASADIVFDDNQAGAFAGPISYNPVDGEVSQSNVNVGTSWLTTYGTTLDSYSFATYLHEIGHALGLGHAGPYDGSATFGSDNLYLNDSSQITMMSYFSPSDNPHVMGSDVSIVTPMVADLVALHALYGTPTAYVGNTTWGENSNVGGWLETLLGAVFDGNEISTEMYSGNPIGFTIFDTEGTDTLDLGTQTANQVISLVPEAVSSVGGQTNNMAIARGTVIENVIGGAGNDRITGNAVANVLVGGGGKDTVDAGAGNDKVWAGVGDAGNDHLTGGSGNDTLGGGGGNDTGFGGSGTDVIYGGTGNDNLFGEAGSDTIWAGSGSDLVYGGTESDTFGGGQGADTLFAGAGNDVVYALTEADFVQGYDGNDLLFGGDGNDTIIGGGGNDTMYGGGGIDVFVFAVNHGDDSIGGFETLGENVIDLSALNLSGFFGALILDQSANGVVVQTGAGSITLWGTSLAEITSDDFIF